MAESSNENETPKSMASDSYTLCSFVDEVESRVDMLRREATALLGERASLLMIMEQLKNDCMNVDIPTEDCQELLTNMERLKARCEAVEIQVHIVRDEGQLQSLHKVTGALEELQTRLSSSQSVSGTAVQQARSYLNACLPEAIGPIDSRFQSLVLGCTVDDQKDVRRRLESLVRKLSTGRHADSSRPDRPNDSFSQTNLSNNSARSADTPPSLDQPASSRLPSDVTIDEKSGDKEVDNFLTPQWFASPTDLACDQETQHSAQTEAEGSRRHPEGDNSSTSNSVQKLSVSDSGS